jgi:hypothetical protein
MIIRYPLLSVALNYEYSTTLPFYSLRKFMELFVTFVLVWPGLPFDIRLPNAHDIEFLLVSCQVPLDIRVLDSIGKLSSRILILGLGCSLS